MSAKLEALKNEYAKIESRSEELKLQKDAGFAKAVEELKAQLSSEEEMKKASISALEAQIAAKKAANAEELEKANADIESIRKQREQEASLLKDETAKIKSDTKAKVA